jgi:hypothetical protein
MKSDSMNSRKGSQRIAKEADYRRKAREELAQNHTWSRVSLTAQNILRVNDRG